MAACDWLTRCNLCLTNKNEDFTMFCTKYFANKWPGADEELYFSARWIGNTHLQCIYNPVCLGASVSSPVPQQGHMTRSHLTT